MNKNKKKTIWILISLVLIIGSIFFVKAMIIDVTTWRDGDNSNPKKYVCPDGTEEKYLSNCK
ncbi:hypothetical protein [Bacillus thuringiensis]|uniref:hypothetical protein n=1 Tax=Bacillus thuringiensis TaxID=1428 RepID=UPI0021D683A9|nr:hypothetical protein [Bacillus thuringiensis]MCU7667763.1 hypothetical protein [Bacillus thuringiensis]